MFIGLFRIVMSGFITLNRDIQKHWIHDNADHFMAWCDILMACNWERREIPCGTAVTICERGECIRSQEQWAKLFGKNWDRSKVQRFFKLLKSAHMIRTKVAHKALKLTVVNYDAYQDVRSHNERNVSATCAQDERNVSTENHYNNNNHSKQSEQDHHDFFTEPKEPIEIDPSNEWHAVKSNLWITELKSIGAKIGANNWQTWRVLVVENTLKKVIEASQAIKASERWPDKVEEQLGPQFGSSDGFKTDKNGDIIL